MANNNSYLWVLDFEDGNVYNYKIDERVFLGDEDYEDFITGAGHSIKSIEWMVTESHLPIRGN